MYSWFNVQFCQQLCTSEQVQQGQTTLTIKAALSPLSKLKTEGKIGKVMKKENLKNNL